MTEPTRDEFFARTTERRVDKINGLELWGLAVYMRSMTAAEKIDFEASVLTDDLAKVDDERLKTAKARLAIFGVCNKAGQPIFEAKDLERVKLMDSKCLEIINGQLEAHIGFDSKDLERLVKNSAAVRAACSDSN